MNPPCENALEGKRKRRRLRARWRAEARARRGSALPGRRAGALEGGRERVPALAVSSEEVGGFLEGTETASLEAGAGDTVRLLAGSNGGGSGSRQCRERLFAAEGPESRGLQSKRDPRGTVPSAGSRCRPGLQGLRGLPPLLLSGRWPP